MWSSRIALDSAVRMLPCVLPGTRNSQFLSFLKASQHSVNEHVIYVQITSEGPCRSTSITLDDYFYFIPKDSPLHRCFGRPNRAHLGYQVWIG